VRVQDGGDSGAVVRPGDLTLLSLSVKRSGTIGLCQRAEVGVLCGEILRCAQNDGGRQDSVAAFNA